MRPIALSLTAFQSFGETVDLEFTHLEKNGVFVISGETGSGKTTILDAMCWALFGELPGERGGVAATPRSNNANPATPTRVVFIFDDAQGSRFRLVRQPAQQVPKKKGDGFTTSAAKATLERHVGDTWEALEDGPKDVGKRVAEIIGLTLDEFTTVVLLPQGLVAKALSDKTNARGQLLRTLFGTEVYQRMTANLEARAAEMSRNLSSDRSKIDALYSGILDHATKALEQDIVNALPLGTVGAYSDGNADPAVALVFLSSLVEAAQAYAVLAGDAFRAASTQLSDLNTVVGQWSRRDELLTQREQQNAHAPYIAQQRSRIELAARAAQCRTVANESEKHRSELTSAEDELNVSESGIVQTLVDIHATGAPFARGITATSTPVELVKVEAELTALAKSHTRIEELTIKQHDAQKQLHEANSQREVLTVNAASANARRTSINEQLPALIAIVENATGAAERHQDARDTLATATAALEASLKRQELEEKRSEAVTRLSSAQLSFENANNAYHSGIASALATQLADGDSCPVCGSHEHPQKAAHVTGDVSRSELDTAQQVLSQAQQVLNTIEANIATQQAIEDTGAAKPSVSELTSQVAELAERITSASTASSTLNGLRAELHELDLADSKTQSGLTACDTAETRLTAELASAIAERTSLEETITAAIGNAELPQFTALVAKFSGMVAAVDTLRQKVASLRSTQSTLDASLATVIAGQKFANEEEFRAALLSDQQLTQLEVEVAQFDTEVQGTSIELEQLAAKNLPAEKPDTTDLHAKVEQLRQLFTSAEQGVGAIKTRLEQANEAMAKAEVLSKALESAEAKAEVVHTVATAVKGVPGKNATPGLEAWILRSILDDVVRHANVWLEELSGHKYQMVSGVHMGAQQGFNELSISILDRRSGEMREVSSLSGGEKFQAALAFSLGLGGAVTSSKGSVNLPCLFVDEGFGTLDSASREKAVAQLISLRGDGNGRVVGIITHIEEIKQMLVSGIEISGPPGNCTVRQPMLAESGIGNTWKADLSPAG